MGRSRPLRERVRDLWRGVREMGFVTFLFWRVGVGHVVMYFAIVTAGVVTFALQEHESNVEAAHNRAAVRREQRQREEYVAASVRARYDDCLGGNALRHGIVLVARHQQLPAAVLRRLFPNVPENLIRRGHDTFLLELRLFAPRDCQRYAREALPSDR